MATFPNYKPIYPAEKTVEPSIRDVSFQRGQVYGFEQRAVFGLNFNRPSWSLTFLEKTEAATEIYDFLVARKIDRESFVWTAPDSTTSALWKCEEFSKELFDFDAVMINAVFIQCFEPV